jgi:hypothetical protein
MRLSSLEAAGAPLGRGAGVPVGDGEEAGAGAPDVPVGCGEGAAGIGSAAKTGEEAVASARAMLKIRVLISGPRERVLT